MIIYGSKMYGVKNVVKGVGACPHCGVYGKYKSYDGRKWGHLYFIPLIPAGKPSRVMKECAGCNMGAHIPQAEVGKVFKETERLMTVCVESAAGGMRTFPDPDSSAEADNDAYLLDSIELLYNLGYDNEIDGLIGLLDSEASRYEHGVALGVYHEARGQADQARSAYEQAARLEPDRLLIHALFGDLASNTGDPESAIAYYSRGLQIQPDHLAIMLSMVSSYERLNRYEELGQLIDRLYGLAPELLKDKRLKKLRKKCEKKTR